MESASQPAFTSGALPPHLLKAAYLVGKIPFRACRLDPRVSYTLYIPEKRYAAVQKKLQSLVKGENLPPKHRLKLIANIPGTRRDASLFRDSLIPLADERGVAILAPLFPAGLDGPLDLSNFKALRSKSLKADLVLLSILEEVGRMWPGIDTDRIILSGFSGGAQFAHRFAYIYPSRCLAFVVGAPGSVTRLDTTKQWPDRIADVQQIFDGRRVDVEGLRSIKHIFLYIGANDVQSSEAVELQEWLAKHVPGFSLDVKGEGKSNRVDQITGLVDDWQRADIRCMLTVMPDVGHEYVKLVPTLVEALRSVLDAMRLA
jgi:hypothetical protein